jgi:N-acetyl-anhydromuramoyl-L-alanine amidase
MHHAEQATDLPVTLFEKGWYQFARQVASPNFGERPADTQINLIVIHSISLPPGKFGGDEVQQLFCNTLDWNAHPYFEKIRDTKVSAHFYIRRNGELWQFVSCDDRAWHAGQSNYLGKDNCNDNSVGIELEGLEGDMFEPQQYDTLASVCSALQQAYPITHFAGHEHIAKGRKADPGAGFDWQKLQCSLGCKNSSLPNVN